MAGFFRLRRLRKAVIAAEIAAALALSSAANVRAQTAPAPSAQAQTSSTKKAQTKLEVLKQRYGEIVAYLQQNAKKVHAAIKNIGSVSRLQLGGTKEEREILYDYIEKLEQLSEIVGEIKKILRKALTAKQLASFDIVILDYAKWIDEELADSSKQVVTSVLRRAVGKQTMTEKRQDLQMALAIFEELYQTVLQSTISFPNSTLLLLNITEELKDALEKIPA